MEGTTIMTTVQVEYKGYDERKDSTILKAAKIFDGSFDGTGFYFSENSRDMTFSFKTKIQASSFRKALSAAFKRKVKINLG